VKHAPTRKLADAIFRGRRGEYIFKVYPLNADVTDQPAVFVISRRIVDGRGKGHQAATCIGETDSIAGELKKHKKARCKKDHATNVVCLFKEKDAKSRNAIVADLTQIRSFECIRNVYEPKIETRSKQRSGARAKAKLPDKKVRVVSGADRPSPVGTKRTAAPKTGARISSGVDRNGRQHRLSDQKGLARREAKGRIDREPGSRKKAAA
jgi:hypothetical protein